MQKLWHVVFHWDGIVSELIRCYRDEFSALFAIRHHVLPDRTFLKSLGISDNDQEVSGSSDGHVEPSHVCEETYTALQILREIASNAVEYDDILLSTLKGVNSIDLYSFALIAALATTERSDIVLKLTNLRLIWGYDTDLSRY